MASKKYKVKFEMTLEVKAQDRDDAELKAWEQLDLDGFESEDFHVAEISMNRQDVESDN